jgi:cytochrome c2
LRRYLLTLTLLLVLLVLGGFAIYRNSTDAAPVQRAYVPTFTSQAEALIFVVGVSVILGSILGLGVVLAITFNRLSSLTSNRVTAESPAAAAKPGAKASGEALPIPLSDNRSLAIFWISLVALIVIFLAIRYSEQPIGYIPDLSRVTATAPAVTATVPAQATSEGGGGDSLEGLQAEFAALPAGVAANGQTVFNSAGCVACHSLEPDKIIVGPSQAGIATRAATRKPGYTAEVYLYESITRPSAYVVEGFPDGVMPKTFKGTLKPQELADVIAFLLTQK